MCSSRVTDRSVQTQVIGHADQTYRSNRMSNVENGLQLETTNFMN